MPKLVSTNPNVELIPLARAKGLPPISKRIMPHTYVAVSKKSKRPAHMVTIASDGLQLAWQSCGTCHQFFTDCTCRTGLHHTQAIAACYVMSDGSKPKDRPMMFTDYEHLFDPYGKAEAAKNEVKTPYQPVKTQRATKPPVSQPDEVTATVASSVDVDVTQVEQAAESTAVDKTRQMRASMVSGKRRIIKRK